MEVFTRLEDGATYEVAPNTMLQSATGIFDLNKKREFSGGIIGSAIPLSSVVSQKSFTLRFISGDITGSEQMAIKDFFAVSDGFFRIEADWLKDNFVDFSVISVEVAAFNGSTMVDLTCLAKYGDFINENEVEIYSTTIAAGGTTTWAGTSQAFTNATSNNVDISVELSTDTVAFWKPAISMRVKKGTPATAPQVAANSGKFDENGNLIGWEGMKWVLNSWDGITEGHGIINPGPSEFWRLKPGEATTIVVPAILRPISTIIPFQVRIVARSVKQKTSF